MNPTSRILRVTLIAVFLAGSAFGSGVPGTTKVVVPIGTHLSDQDFASVGAARLQDYEAFRVYRVPSAALAKLQAAAAAEGEAIEVHDEWDTVLFRNRSIDTRGAGKVVLDPAGADTLQMYVVQFTSPLTTSDEQLLSNAGAFCVGYIPSNAVLVAAHSRALAAAVAGAPRVQWLSVYERSLKPSLPAIPLAADEFVVQFATTPETGAHIQAFLAHHEVIQISSYLQYTNVRVRLSLSEAAAAIDDPFVVVVEPAGHDFVSGEREAISTTNPFITSRFIRHLPAHSGSRSGPEPQTIVIGCRLDS
jgi:hypothetical protein